MFAEFLKPSPDSLLARNGTVIAGSKAWYPVFMLAWTVFIFVTPLYEPNAFGHWFWPTMATFVVFLLLYHQAFFRSERRLPWLVAGMSLLSFVALPFNPGAQCYLIYACGFVAYCGTSRRALMQMFAMVGAFALVWLAIGWSLVYIASAVLMAFAVGLMNLSFRRRMAVDAALRLSHEQVRQLAAVAERERIGRDLHDLLGHTLSLVALKADLAARLVELDGRAARSEIDDVARISREALAQVRRAVTGIRAAALPAELVSARLLLEADGIALEYRADADLVLSPERETVLALTLREAATNVQRHARARRVEVTLEQCQGRVRLTVRDDGCGGEFAAGNGLRGMRERLQVLGGELQLGSRAGHGTSLVASLPLPVADPVTKPMEDLAVAEVVSNSQ